MIRSKGRNFLWKIIYLCSIIFFVHFLTNLYVGLNVGTAIFVALVFNLFYFFIFLGIIKLINNFLKKIMGDDQLSGYEGWLDEKDQYKDPPPEDFDYYKDE